MGVEDDYYFVTLPERVAELEAENERLRKALDEIANGPWFADKSYPVLFAHITAKAREALEAKP